MKTKSLKLPIIIIAIGILLAIAASLLVSIQKTPTVTMVFHYIIGFVAFPFFTIFAGLLNALGDIGTVMNLITYLLPALTILCITASIGLRRKLYGKSALAVQFTTPAVFVIIMIISLV